MPVKWPVKTDHRVTAFCSARALKQNFRALVKRAKGSSVLPMVKANAYGHGLEWAVQTLNSEVGFRGKIDGFGVATFSEAEMVRRILKSKASPRVVLFSGAMPWTRENQDRCVQSKITPVISSLRDLELFLRERGDHFVPSYELKFNTGMNRLGIRCDEWSAVETVFQNVKRTRSVKSPAGVFSHLAVAENADHVVSKIQLQQFKNLVPEWRRLFPGVKLHLGNSAALWNASAFELAEHTEIVRPGLSLYGIRPFPEAQAKDLKPVMELCAPVVQIIEVQPGESVGYGAQFQVPQANRTADHDLNDSARRIAILAAGYGDGVPRALENKGRVSFGKTLEPFAGRISMDLSAIVASQHAPQKVLQKSGDWVEIFGHTVDIWNQAEAAGTIPYEFLTSLAARVERKYDD